MPWRNGHPTRVPQDGRRVTAVRAFVTGSLVAVLLAWGHPTDGAAQAGCSLSPVFALFRQVAGTTVLGECKEPPAVSPNGDITQTTTRGLAVYRYSDQVIAFTDGQTTWLFGPEGLQSRPISDKFAWETSLQPSAASASAPVPTSPAVAARAASTPTPLTLDDGDNQESAPVSRLTGALRNRCQTIVTELGIDLGVPPPPSLGRECLELGDRYGRPGVDCLEDAWKHGVRLIKQGPGPGSGGLVAQIVRSRLDTCLEDLE